MLQTNPNKIKGFNMWPQFSEASNYHMHVSAANIESQSCYNFDKRTENIGLVKTFLFIESVKDQGLDANNPRGKCV